MSSFRSECKTLSHTKSFYEVANEYEDASECENGRSIMVFGFLHEFSCLSICLPETETAVFHDTLIFRTTESLDCGPRSP